MDSETMIKQCQKVARILGRIIGYSMEGTPPRLCPWGEGDEGAQHVWFSEVGYGGRYNAVRAGENVRMMMDIQNWDDADWVHFLNILDDVDPLAARLCRAHHGGDRAS